jgi:EAL domain-containing protein (putative c-di-GMP-specific phosphodiesterase class I)
MTLDDKTIRADSALICVDEVGVGYAVLDPYRVRTGHRPAFARIGDSLTPVAATAEPRLHSQGERLATEAVLAECGARSRAAMLAAFHRIVPGNHVAHGLEDLDLHVRLRPPGANVGTTTEDEVETLIDCLADADLSPERLVVDLTAAQAAEPTRLNAIAAVLRHAGARISLDIACAGLLLRGNASVPRPDIVHVGQVRLHDLARQPGKRDRLVTRIAELRRRGSRLQVDGIRTQRHLGMALSLQPDLMSGDALACSQLCGTAFDGGDRSLSTLFGEGGNVVRLFA